MTLADHIADCCKRYKGDLLISVSLTDEQWEQIIFALRHSGSTALILRCRNCGSTNVEDAKSSSDKVLVPRDAWEGFQRMIQKHLGQKDRGDITPQRVLELARAMLAAAALGQEPHQKSDDSSSKG